MTLLLLIFIGLLFILMAISLPIAYAIGLTCLVAILLTAGIDSSVAELLANRLYYGINSFTLLALPLYILAGQIMNEAKLTDRIFNFVNEAFGHVTGGLGHVNVIASMLFAGMSGSATSDAGGLGAVELKAMKEANYPDDFSVGITASSSMIGPIIPPSIPMVLYGVIANVSISKLFMGGFLPGILMGLSLMLLTAYYAWKGNWPSKKRSSTSAILKSFRESFFSLITPLIIIGGIWCGIFTPTEAGAVAVAYSLFLGLIMYRSMNLKDLWIVFNESAKLSVKVLFILTFGSFYGYLLIRYRIPMVLTEFLTGFLTTPLALVLVLNVFFLIVSCFLSTSVSITILTPIIIPILKAFGVDPLYFGVIMVFNLTLGNITPPFGVVLYVMTSITGMDIIRVFRSVLPFLITLIFVLLLCILFPPIVTYIPLTLMP